MPHFSEKEAYEFFERHYSRVKAFIRSIVKEDWTAEDLTQETFIRVLKKWPDLKDRDRHAVCRQCDWECFRDPSELLGPLLTLASEPVRFIRRMMKDARYRNLWIEDLRYYAACDYFHAASPPDYGKLSLFRMQRGSA